MVALAIERPTETLEMSRADAELALVEIRASLARAREILADFKARRGWRVLGYESFAACAAAEFGKSISQLYREVVAGEIALILSPMGELSHVPERQLRPLAKLKDEPDLMRYAWRVANDTAPDGKVTSTWVESTVRVVQEALATGGHVDVGERQVALKAAITAEEYERMERQRQHIREGKTPPVLNAEFPNRAEAARALFRMESPDGARLRVVVYVVCESEGNV